MKCYRSLEELGKAESGQFGLALGVFDGYHLGHQAVIDAARGSGLTGVLTFDPHPAEIFAPDRAPQRVLESIAHQMAVLEELKVDFLVVLEFSREFAEIPAEKFAQMLTTTGVSRLSTGYDWSFGKGRAGNIARLKEWAPGVDVVQVEALLHDDSPISSTRVRDALSSEDLARAEELLGRPYSVRGEVQQGRQLGRQLGFPTANVSTHESFLPANGVYAISGKKDGEWISGVANVGVRPTVDDSPKRSLEVHIFSDDIPQEYGWDLEVAFLEKIREEKKFNNIAELKAQIAQDIVAAKSR